jgi:hypothetical protein
VCGDDGCGGSCGACSPGAACRLDGQCTTPCTPFCGTAECGDDGCGGDCGSCASSTVCRYGVCVPQTYGIPCPNQDECGENEACLQITDGDGALVDSWCSIQCATPGPASAECTAFAGGCCLEGDGGNICSFPTYCTECNPNCVGRECGPNGCSGTCGTCGAGETCSAGGTCVGCTPNCSGRLCGSDGCDGSCGSCDFNEYCADGACVCIPDCRYAVCGTDGCGGSCGDCPDDLVCQQGECRVPGGG